MRIDASTPVSDLLKAAQTAAANFVEHVPGHNLSLADLAAADSVAEAVAAIRRYAGAALPYGELRAIGPRWHVSASPKSRGPQHDTVEGAWLRWVLPRLVVKLHHAHAPTAIPMSRL
jgi:hypothetical protein